MQATYITTNSRARLRCFCGKSRELPYLRCVGVCLTCRRPWHWRCCGNGREPLRRNGDMLLLTDIYCMYNRARGTDLVSPDDVLAACKQLQRLRLGMKLRVFSSGVMVVQSDSHDPAAVVARLMKLLKSREYLDAAFLARTWRVSVPVAEEHLHVRVRMLCVYVFVCCCLFVCVLMQPLAVGDSRATLVLLGVAGSGRGAQRRFVPRR